MAAAAITIIENPATIESDATGAVITKALRNMSGYLCNLGTADVFMFASVDDRVPATTAAVAVTNAQAQQIFVLPAGASMPWLRSYNSIAHKTASGTAVLIWYPEYSVGR